MDDVPPTSGHDVEYVADAPRYDAFLSYAHHDRAAAVAVQAGLRRVAVSRLRRSTTRIYRDDTNLASTPELWPTIAEALDRSRHLVLLASPGAARSQAVNWEVSRFLAREPRRPVHVVLVDGTLRWAGSGFDEASTALVPALRAFTAEPLVLELGTGPRRLRLGDDTFRRCMVRLAAPIRGLTPEELYDVDRVNQRRALQQAVVAIVLLVLFLGAAVFFGLAARHNAEEAQRQATRATARFLATQSGSLLARDPELGMLAAVHAAALEDSVGPRQALLAAVRRSPMLTGTARSVEGAPFSDVAVSPTGRTVVTVDQRDRLQVWEVRGGRPVLRAGFQASTRPLDVTLPSDEEVVAALDSGEVLSWRPDGDVRNVWQPVVSPEGAFVDHTAGMLITADDRFVLTIWDRAGRRAVTTTPPLASRPDVVTVSSDGARLGVAADRKATVFDLSTGQVVGTPVDLGAGYSPAVAFSPDLGRVVADSRHTDNVLAGNDTIEAGGGPDPEGVVVVDLATGGRGTSGKPGGTTTALAYLPDGHHVLAGEDTGEVRVLSDTPPLAGTEPGHVGAVNAVAVNADGTVGVSVDAGGRLLVRDLTLRLDLGTDARAAGPVPPQQSARVSELSFDSADRRLLTAADNGQVLLGDLTTGTTLATINGVGLSTSQNVVGARFADDGAVVFTSLGGSLGRLVDGATTAEKAGTPGPGSLVATIPDGRVVTGGRDGSVSIWESKAGVWASTALAGPAPDNVVSLDVSPDGRLLAVAREDAAVEVWDLDGRQLRSTVPDRSRAIAVIGASPTARFGADSRTLAVGRPDGTVVLWDAVSGSLLGEPMSIGEGAVSAVALSPDATMLAAVEDQGRGVQLLDVASRRMIGTVADELGRTSAVAFSHDGTRLAVGNVDGAVRMIDVSVRSWRERLCALSGREITKSEWEGLVGDYPLAPACP